MADPFSLAITQANQKSKPELPKITQKEDPDFSGYSSRSYDDYNRESRSEGLTYKGKIYGKLYPLSNFGYLGVYVRTGETFVKDSEEEVTQALKGRLKQDLDNAYSILDYYGLQPKGS